MVTGVYQYDSYGQVELGSTKHTDFYGYNAESYNPNSELEYLRARYYNANQERSFQEDTYLGNIIDPLTLNRYNYVKSSPLNYTDQTGKMAVETLQLINFLHQISLINNDQTAFLILAINLFKLDVQLLKDIKVKWILTGSNMFG